MRKSSLYDVSILKNKTLVIEKHVDCERNSWFVELEDRVENPYPFDQHQMRHRSAPTDERLSRRCLLCIVSRD